MDHNTAMPTGVSNRLFSRNEDWLGLRLIGEGKLKHADIAPIIDLQQKNGMHFGEAARFLGLLSEADLQHALAKQYDVPHGPGGMEGVSAELVAAYAPHHSCVEELRALRTQLLIRWLNPAAGRTVLAVVSSDRGDGRSYATANLGVVLSQLGMRTLIIDADLRQPRQHRIFNVANRLGLAAVLADRADHTVAIPVPGFSRLSLLPAGPLPPNPQELLSRPSLPALLKAVQLKFDVVVIDTSAATASSDTQNVTFHAGSAIVLARKNHSRVADTERLVGELCHAGTFVAGTVINSFL